MTIDDFLKMPTSKSAIPTKRYSSFLKYHYNRMNTDTMMSVIDYIRSSGLASGSQATLTQGLCRFFIEAEMFKSKEIRLLRATFPHENNMWSEKMIDKDVIVKLINYIQNNSSSKYHRDRNTAIIMFLANFGMRAEQLLNLKCSDIILNHKAHLITLNLLKQKGRNMYSRQEFFSVVLNYDAEIAGISVYEAYNNNMLHIKDNNYFIGTETGGNKISYERLRLLFADLSDKLNIKCTAHSLRHYVASVTTEKYGIAVANALLNHSKLDTTRKYVNKESLLEKTYGVK